MTGPMTGCGFEREDGAYVLGALSPEDRAAFERHLSGCEACARSVRELAGLPGLLARVPVQIVDPDQPQLPVPATLLPSLVRRARRTQRRRVWATAGLVAAAVTIAAVSVGSTLGPDNPQQPTSGVTAPEGSPPTAAPQQFTRVGTGSISGWVSLTGVAWGTRIDLTCSYAGGSAYEAGLTSSYTMAITHRDGSVEQVASWTAPPGRTMHLSAATSAKATDITRVVVRTADGHDVLDLEPVSG